MTDRDQDLIALFAQAEQEFDNDAFVADVMSQIDRDRRTALIIWIVLISFVIACIAAFATPVIAAVNMATQLLPMSLVDVQAGWVRQLISPVNSVAAALALILLGIIRFFRKVFR